MRAALTLLALVGSPAVLWAQYPSGRWVLPPVHPYERRQLRERAVLHAGPAARGLVESPYGDEGALALLMCSPNTAAQLAAFHAAGNLGRLHRPRDLLLVIAQPNCRDGMALWVIGHAAELVDPDCCNAFLKAPFEYALGLKSLSQQRNPLSATVAGPDRAPALNRQTLTWVAVIGVVGLLVWRVRHNRLRDAPA